MSNQAQQLLTWFQNEEAKLDDILTLGDDNIDWDDAWNKLVDELWGKCQEANISDEDEAAIETAIGF